MNEKDRQLFWKAIDQQEQKTKTWKHSNRLAFKILQINVVEERRKGVSAVFSYEMIQVSLIDKLFSIKRVKGYQQK